MQLLCGIPPMQAVAAGEAAMCADDYVRAVQLFTAALHSGASDSRLPSTLDWISTLKQALALV